MTADPNPLDTIGIVNADRSIVLSDTYRPHFFDAFEVK